MNGLGGRVANGAAGKGLGMGLGRALIALGLALANNRDLAQISGRATLHQRHIGRQTHSIDVAAGRSIVQGIQHQLELLEERQAVVRAEKKANQNFEPIYPR